MNSKREIESFSLNISTNGNNIEVFHLANISKHLKLNKNFIKFDVKIIKILLTILVPSILNRHFNISSLFLVLTSFLQILKIYSLTLHDLQVYLQ